MTAIVNRLRSSRLSVLVLCVLVGALLGTLVLASLGTGAEGSGECDDCAAEGGHDHEAQEEGIVELTEETRRLAGIEVEALRRRALDEWLEAPGVLHANPDETATVSPAVGGTVERVLVTVGDPVARGQAIAVLRCPELAAAQADAATAAAELQAAEEALARRKALAAEGGFASAPYEEARRAHDETQEALRLAEATLQRVQRLAELGAPNQPAAEEAAEDLSDAREAVRTAEAELAAASESLATARRIADRLANGSSRPPAEARVTQAQTALDTARANRARLERLLADGLATEQEVTASQVEEAKAQADLEEARQALRTAETPADEAHLAVKTTERDVARAQTRLVEAKARLQLCEARHAREQTVAAEGLPAQQQIAEAKTQVAVARAAHEQARLAWEREQRLYKGDLRSREALADAESAVVGARARLRAAERLVGVLGQGRQGANGRVTLVAPVSGKVSARGIRVGAMVAPGEAVLEIIGARSIWVEAAFYEKDLPRLAPGQAMQVELAGFPSQPFRTSVYAIDAALDEHTRKAKVRGLLDNPRGKLLPDMLAKVRIRVGTLGQALAVPEEAVQGDGDCQFVFVEEQLGRYRRVEVQVGEHSDGLVEIRSGVQAGARVVVKGAFLLKSESSEISDTCGH